MRRVPAALQKDTTVSRRLLPKADPRLFTIHKMVSPQACVIADPDTGSTELGFAQPVAVSRLIPFDLHELQAPIESDTPLVLEILEGTTWTKAEITKQNATGAVKLKFEDGSEKLVHLEREEYRWIS